MDIVLNIVLWIVFGLIAGAVGKLLMPGKDPGRIVVTMLLYTPWPSGRRRPLPCSSAPRLAEWLMGIPRAGRASPHSPPWSLRA
jgi:hypothetical protein